MWEDVESGRWDSRSYIGDKALELRTAIYGQDEGLFYGEYKNWKAMTGVEDELPGMWERADFTGGESEVEEKRTKNYTVCRIKYGQWDIYDKDGKKLFMIRPRQTQSGYEVISKEITKVTYTVYFETTDKCFEYIYEQIKGNKTTISYVVLNTEQNPPPVEK